MPYRLSTTFEFYHQTQNKKSSEFISLKTRGKINFFPKKMVNAALLGSATCADANIWCIVEALRVIGSECWMTDSVIQSALKDTNIDHSLI